MTDWISELSFAKVCLHKKTYLYIRLVFACLYICKPFSIPDVLNIGRCFRAFQILLKITPTTGFQHLCAIFGDQKNVYHVIHWPGSFGPGCGGGEAFWTQKISNLNVFTYWKIAENDWLNFGTFLCWSLFAQEDIFIYVYVLFLLVFIFENLFPFLMFSSKTMFSSFPKFLLQSTPTAHLHPQCVRTKKTCNMSSIDRAHLGRDVGGGGFLNPKNLKFERFHILKNS